jgi:REP element-mobilizing transposase RayT
MEPRAINHGTGPFEIFVVAIHHVIAEDHHLLVDQAFGLHVAMSNHERRPPHCYPPEAVLFLTWRLFGSLRGLRQTGRSFPDPGKSFAQTDRLPDMATDGPLRLKDRRVAALVAGALDQGENEYRLYERCAWVIMPNHVHVIMRPFRLLPEVMRWIKGSTARSANLLLERTGRPFWQYETYDHCVRNSDELNRVIRYIERNPVR